MQSLNLQYLEEVSGGDNAFKKELINIFLTQVPEFISNMKHFLTDGNLKELAKEAHTAKSSVLIFGMVKTGNTLKEIQHLSEKNETAPLSNLLQETENELTEISDELTELLKSL